RRDYRIPQNDGRGIGCNQCHPKKEEDGSNFCAHRSRLAEGARRRKRCDVKGRNEMRSISAIRVLLLEVVAAVCFVFASIVASTAVAQQVPVFQFMEKPGSHAV